MTGSRIPAPIRYDAQLRERVGTHLAAHRRRVAPPGEERRAAVALVLVDSTPQDAVSLALQADGTPVEQPAGRHDGLRSAAGGAAVLLCRRPLHLRRHAGQYALPGGRLEAGEEVVAAALRETHEEVGVALGEERVLGLLDDYVTRSGFVMTPVVVWGGQVEVRPDPGEVMAVYRVGLHQLDRPGSPWFTRIGDSDRQVVALPLGSTVLHAPTAAVLVQLRWLGLHGRSDPVAHLEEPVFAWR